jgi:hypothetical protein
MPNSDGSRHRLNGFRNALESYRRFRGTPDLPAAPAPGEDVDVPPPTNLIPLRPSGDRRARAEQARKRGGSAPFDVGERRVFKMSLGRAGSKDQVFDAAIASGYVVMGWGGKLDWSDPRFESFDAVKARWSEIEPGVSGNSGNVAQVFNFRGSMRKGDFVVVSYGNHAFRAVGEITGDYRYDPTGFRTYNHRRDVRWPRAG